ncbi:MAG: hypothetical protein A2138_14845 [Deltaproteobacteria bacterium RBG_16_71_12]|nr:MAG: hypothetical protein A2138_14845 [Deltaproteobacteria bacterium RBG_16_71_12]
MRIQSNPYSAHQAGMSALWHDTDYLPEQRFETPIVRKTLDDLPLPGEHHQLPDGVADPFARMEAVFDVAAEQMERGVRGAAFLHGKPPAAGLDPAQHATRLERQQERDVARAANAVAKAKGSSKTAADTDADTATTPSGPLDEVIGVAATFLPTAGAHAAQHVVQGPLPALASQAVQVAGAVISSGQIAATGVAERLRDDEPVVVRRGLRKS